MLVLFYLTAPAGILFLCRRFPILNKIGAIVIAYIVGFIIGNSGWIDADFARIQNQLSTIMVLLAIPLLLFSLHIRSWFKVSGNTFLALFVGLVALVISIASGYYFFGSRVEESWKVAGMLTGVYSGGTPNLASIKEALQVSENTYILTHTYDIIFSTLYLFFLITIGKVIFRRFLPDYKVVDVELTSSESALAGNEDYRGIFKKKTFLPLLAAFGISIVSVGLGAGLSLLFPEPYSTVVAILSITTVAILMSLVPAVSRIPKTFETGMYFILVFSIVVASMADFSKFNITSLPLMYFVAYAVFATLFLHVLLAKIFRVDADTVMITSVAMIFSPPFVPLVAGALKNKQIILSGLVAGLIGYAVGNYLGVTLAFLLK
jgi:uncharacterized membrane protein